MPKPKHIRVGNEVMVADAALPNYGQYAVVKDYHKARNMLLLELVPTGSTLKLQFEAMPQQVCLTMNKQPVFPHSHVGDYVVVVNTMNPLYGEEGCVHNIKPVTDGLLYKIQEVNSGNHLHFYAEEIAPIVNNTAKFLTGSGVSMNNTGVKVVRSTFRVGDYVVVDEPNTPYFGEKGFITQVNPHSGILEIEMDCDLKRITVKDHFCYPAATTSAAGIPVRPAPLNEPEEADSYGVGQPKEKVFDHASLGTDLSGDELMKSIRDICGGR